MDLLLYLLIGAFAGLSAAMIIDGPGLVPLGPLWDVLFGTAGGLGAGALYARHGMDAMGIGGEVISSLIGAIGLLLLANGVKLAIGAFHRRGPHHHHAPH